MSLIHKLRGEVDNQKEILKLLTLDELEELQKRSEQVVMNVYARNYLEILIQARRVNGELTKEGG